MTHEGEGPRVLLSEGPVQKIELAVRSFQCHMPRGMHGKTRSSHVKEDESSRRTEDVSVQSPFLGGDSHARDGKTMPPLRGLWGPLGRPIPGERRTVVPGRPRMTSHWASLGRKVLRRRVFKVPLRKRKNMPPSLHPGRGHSTSPEIIATGSHQATLSAKVILDGLSFVIFMVECQIVCVWGGCLSVKKGPLIKRTIKKRESLIDEMYAEGFRHDIYQCQQFAS